ncbi:hypothetical protein ACWGKX_42500, partial [Streptomyces tricolor]
MQPLQPPTRRTYSVTALGWSSARLWAGELEAVHGRFVHRFSRSEPRESALACMRGLIAPLQR